MDLQQVVCLAAACYEDALLVRLQHSEDVSEQQRPSVG